jgi:hypothetical protein
MFKFARLGDWAMAADDILCPICGRAIDLKECVTDEHGLAVHLVCLTLKKQGMPAHPPKKPGKS